MAKSAAVIVGAAARRRADRAMQRYKRDSYALAVENFRTYDPKDKSGVKLEKPWMHTPSTEEIWNALASGDYDEARIHKSKQTFGSWGAVGFATACMLIHPGFRAYAQSRMEDISLDLIVRSQYILQNLAGPLKGALVEGRDFNLSGSVLTLDSFLGEIRRSDFTALPRGEKAWRYAAASLGILDELAYHDKQEKTHAAARSACEGGGLLLCISSGVFGTFFNQDLIKADIRAAKGAQCPIPQTLELA